MVATIVKLKGEIDPEISLEWNVASDCPLSLDDSQLFLSQCSRVRSKKDSFLQCTHPFWLQQDQLEMQWHTWCSFCARIDQDARSMLCKDEQWRNKRKKIQGRKNRRNLLLIRHSWCVVCSCCFCWRKIKAVVVINPELDASKNQKGWIRVGDFVERMLSFSEKKKRCEWVHQQQKANQNWCG